MTQVRRNKAGFILINHCNYPTPAALPMAKQIMVLIKFHYVVSLAYKLQMDEELFWYDFIQIYMMTNMIFKEFSFILYSKAGIKVAINDMGQYDDSYPGNSFVYI